MLTLMGARLDKNIDFETIRETAEKANPYTKTYSKRSKIATANKYYIRTDQCGHPTVWDSGCELHCYMVYFDGDLRC